jgi:hypothetical protein
MRTGGQNFLTFWEGVVIFGLMAGTIAITKAVGVAPEWETACVYTVIVFGVVTISLRPAWGRLNFWWSIGIAFVIHTLAIFFVFRELPATSRDFHGIPFIVSCMVEGLFIAGVSWRVSMKRQLPHV